MPLTDGCAIFFVLCLYLFVVNLACPVCRLCQHVWLRPAGILGPRCYTLGAILVVVVRLPSLSLDRAANEGKESASLLHE